MHIPPIYRKELAELEEKIDSGFGSEADILRLQEIWRNIIEETNKEGALGTLISCSARHGARRAVKRIYEQSVNYLFPNCRLFIIDLNPGIHNLFIYSLQKFHKKLFKTS